MDLEKDLPVDFAEERRLLEEEDDGQLGSFAGVNTDILSFPSDLSPCMQSFDMRTFTRCVLKSTTASYMQTEYCSQAFCR